MWTHRKPHSDGVKPLQILHPSSDSSTTNLHISKTMISTSKKTVTEAKHNTNLTDNNHLTNSLSDNNLLVNDTEFVGPSSEIAPVSINNSVLDTKILADYTKNYNDLQIGDFILYLSGESKQNYVGYGKVLRKVDEKDFTIEIRVYNPANANNIWKQFCFPA